MCDFVYVNYSYERVYLHVGYVGSIHIVHSTYLQRLKQLWCTQLRLAIIEYVLFAKRRLNSYELGPNHRKRIRATTSL